MYACMYVYTPAHAHVYILDRHTKSRTLLIPVVMVFTRSNHSNAKMLQPLATPWSLNPEPNHKPFKALTPKAGPQEDLC